MGQEGPDLLSTLESEVLPDVVLLVGLVAGLFLIKTGIHILGMTPYEREQLRKRVTEDQQFVRWMNGRE